MNLYNAIMQAADHIERYPKDFNFLAIRIPGCGSPGCALGWIGFYAEAAGDYCDVASKVLRVPGSEKAFEGSPHFNFYSRMDGVAAGMEWRRNAAYCATALRRYADRYHGHEKPDSRTNAELVKHWMAVVKQKHIDEHSVSQELTW